MRTHCHVPYDTAIYQILPRRLHFIIIAYVRTYNFVFINLLNGMYKIYISPVYNLCTIVREQTEKCVVLFMLLAAELQ